MSRLDECLEWLLPIEGGYVNDPVDRGGATNKGITQRELDSWLKSKGRPTYNVADLTDVDCHDCYQDDYWLKLQADTFGKPLDLVLFDTAVNHGVSRAVKILQETLLLPADGVLGPVTVHSAQLDPAPVVALDMLIARAGFYTRIVQNTPSQARFSNGWANRLDKLKIEAGV
jgi:lysozyme family protein